MLNLKVVSLWLALAAAVFVPIYKLLNRRLGSGFNELEGGSS
jgi:drug/metabolite transporter (DMT)-like permease